MNLEDILIAPRKVKTEKWQFGHTISTELQENGIALIFCSDYRGTVFAKAEIQDYHPIRKELYQLSKLDFEVPVCDLGDFISGKTPQDTHFMLQELLLHCHNKNILPIVIGGGNDLAYSLFSALNNHHPDINYTQISSHVYLSGEGELLNERNFLAKIFSSKTFTLKDYHHLGYQNYLNEMDSIKLMKQVDFDILRLSEMMNSTARAEPFFRHADLVTFNCDAVESYAEPFSVNAQVNGLNRREICAYMKEAGLSRKLKSAGIFNYNVESSSFLNHQLLAQMIWHLIEGINIRRSHPKEQSFETYWLMIHERKYAFQRDVFSDLWYFGESDKEDELIPCSVQDYDAAKKGFLNPRLLRNL